MYEDIIVDCCILRTHVNARHSNRSIALGHWYSGEIYLQELYKEVLGCWLRILDVT